MAELNLIHKIAERKDVFPLLIKSICPSIFGHELPKTGQLLSLFGGTDYRLKNKASAGEFSDFMICQNDKGNNNNEDEDDENSKN
jgi:DNA helicase MCM8